MTIERKNGGYLISSIVKGYLVSRFFLGYTRKEAISLYRGFIRADFKI